MKNYVKYDTIKLASSTKKGDSNVMNEFRKRLECSQEVLNAHFKLSIKLNDPLFEFFLKMGADPDAHHCYAIRAKSEIGDLDSIKLLCKYGADPEPGLDIAIRNGHYSVVKFFLEDMGLKPHKWNLRDAIKKNDYSMGRLILREVLEEIDSICLSLKEVAE